jgi:hypothetical protein
MNKLSFTTATVITIYGVWILLGATAQANAVKNPIIVAAMPTLPRQNTTFTEVKPTGENQEVVFNFSALGYKYTITALGQASTVTNDSKKISSKIDVEEGFIEKLAFMEYEGNLLLLTELTDNDVGWGKLYSLSPKNFGLKWKAHIPGFNVGEALIEKKYAYITAIGFVAKINLNNGRYIWQNNNLYKRNKAFNSFVKPQLKGQQVIFRSGDGYVADTARSIVVDTISGKILTIK